MGKLFITSMKHECKEHKSKEHRVAAATSDIVYMPVSQGVGCACSPGHFRVPELLITLIDTVYAALTRYPEVCRGQHKLADGWVQSEEAGSGA